MSKKDDEYLSLEDRLIWSAYVIQENIKGDQESELLSFEDLLIYEEGVDMTVKNKMSAKNYKKPDLNFKTHKKSSEIDRRTDEKLRKGKMRIEARCDLHGLNQVQAHELLKNFINSAAARGCRCVLVITGKGKSKISSDMVIEPERGILKQKVPQWLFEPDIRPYILKSYPAQPKDGGTGALYVYLRRKK